MRKLILLVIVLACGADKVSFKPVPYDAPTQSYPAPPPPVKPKPPLPDPDDRPVWPIDIFPPIIIDPDDVIPLPEPDPEPKDNWPDCEELAKQDPFSCHGEEFLENCEVTCARFPILGQHHFFYMGNGPVLDRWPFCKFLPHGYWMANRRSWGWVPHEDFCRYYRVQVVSASTGKGCSCKVR